MLHGKFAANFWWSDNGMVL